MSNNISVFKLRNIEEFDADFVQNLRIAKQPPVKSENKVSGLIPEFDKSASVNQPQIAPQTDRIQVQTEKPAPRPLVPIGSGQTAIPPSQEKLGGNTLPKNTFLGLDESDFDDEEDETKTAKGALALKIISIIFLSITVLIFLIGCLVSVFINNDGSKLAGYCFNSQIRDVTFKTDIGDIALSDGDLIISRPLGADEYETNMIVSVLATDGENNKYCDIYSIGTVTKISNDVADIDLIDPENGTVVGTTTSTDCYGLVEYYLPVVGGVLSFTTSSIINSVLICALFILIVAFWALLLALSDKKIKAAKELN